ncbi:hypothetical protein GCM10023085_65810 [Actinomadura viridis]|uniref:DUF5709 domain-containing protein n=1 Tax=Actinomadura viridis TaxID=58110 RepID=A0A931DKZ8_9ACTN|nr:DUF5709 domain-containing protein [Actinomadura viridis]MBG6091402.1 hypothetical protein [Actinomadura viridis]
MTERYASGPEDEGVPDLRDDTPEQYWGEDPQEAALPGDRPTAVDDYGTTADEMREGEPLDGRLRREEPERPLPENEPENPAGRLVEEDEGVRPDTEPDAVARDVGPDGGGYTAEERAIRVEEE